MSEAIDSKQKAIEGVVNNRLKNLVKFLEEMNEGSVNQAKALWVMNRVHLSEHPVNYYFRIVIDAGIIDVDGDGRFRFKYNPFSSVHAKPVRMTTRSKLQKYIEKEEIREKMKAGPCRHAECPPGAEDCRNCSGYLDERRKLA